jgi:prepilin-type N-terminal cleavage/methylation domain-containing protein
MLLRTNVFEASSTAYQPGAPATGACDCPSLALQAGWNTPRAAYTLVELLVVIGIILVLAGMALYLVPSISSQQQATQAGTQLQQWIEIAKQRAGRDRAPRGIRLLPGTPNSMFVTQLEYIEQPPDFWLGPGSTFTTGVSATSGLPIVTFTGGTTTLSGGVGNPGKFLPNVPAPLGKPNPNAGSYPVQPGDRIALGSSEETHTILAVSNVMFNPAKGININEITLVPPPPPMPPGYTNTAIACGLVPPFSGYTPSSFTSASQYRIIRQPRTIGDDPLQMPANIVIDLTARGFGYDLTMQAPGIDLMFAPDGRLIGPLAAYDKIILWVRDTTVPDGQNDPALVCIYPRTGLVAACLVDEAYFISGGAATPYTFTANGRRSSQ